MRCRYSAARALGKRFRAPNLRMRRALACLWVASILGAGAALPRRGLARDIAAESDAPPPPGPRQPPPAPGAPAKDATTHPLTVLPQFQLDGVSAELRSSIVELVSRGLRVLGEAVRLPGPAPAPLLLPRSCMKIREWARRDGGVTATECVEVRALVHCFMRKMQALHAPHFAL